jgi:Transposase
MGLGGVKKRPARRGQGRAKPCGPSTAPTGPYNRAANGLGMPNQLFEAALGISKPWSVRGIDFDAAQKVLTIGIDFVGDSRFCGAGCRRGHPVHDTQTKRLRHLNFFQYECFLEVTIPRVKLRAILDRKQINVVSALLKQWCTNVRHSKVEPMKEVAGMIRRHFDGIVAWT